MNKIKLVSGVLPGLSCFFFSIVPYTACTQEFPVFLCLYWQFLCGWVIKVIEAVIHLIVCGIIYSSEN